METVLQDQRHTLVFELRDEATEALADATGTVTLAVTDSAGVAVTGSPFTATKPTGTTGRYEVVLTPAQTVRLDEYAAKWQFVRDTSSQTETRRFEVVGRRIVTIQELRDFDAQKLEDKGAYPLDVLKRARAEAEERIEDLIGVAFRPRGARVEMEATGDALLILPKPHHLFPRKIISASVDVGGGPVAFTQPEIDELDLLDWGALRRPGGKRWMRASAHVKGGVKLFYEYGFGEAPAPIRRAVCILASHYVIDGVGSRVISRATDIGSERWSTAGKDGPTGIPEVDAIVEQFDQTREVL